MAKIERYPLNIFTSPYKTKLVYSGKRDIIWRFKVPNKYVFFVERMYILWLPNIVNKLYVDGLFIEEYRRQVGDPSNPELLSPPLVVKNDIYIESYNGSGRDVLMEAIINGYLVPRKYLKLI